MKLEELVGWMVEMGYREDFVREQIERASYLNCVIKPLNNALKCP